MFYQKELRTLDVDIERSVRDQRHVIQVSFMRGPTKWTVTRAFEWSQMVELEIIKHHLIKILADDLVKALLKKEADIYV